MTSIVIRNRDKIIDHVSKGGRLDDLGLPVTHQAISKALKDDPEYQDAKLDYHRSRLDKAEMMIEIADDQVAVARARALHQAYSWRASKEQRDIYGDRPDQSSSGVTIVINTQDSRGVLIQGDGGVLQAGGGELGEASSCMPSSTGNESSTDNESSTQVRLPNDPK